MDLHHSASGDRAARLAAAQEHQETPCPADAMSDGKPCAEHPSAPGTQPTEHSAGPAPTLSDVLVQMQALTQALMQQALAIDNLAASNERLADEVAALAPDEADEGEGAGVDMSGKPIRVS